MLSRLRVPEPYRLVRAPREGSPTVRREGDDADPASVTEQLPDFVPALHIPDGNDRPAVSQSDVAIREKVRTPCPAWPLIERTDRLSARGVPKTDALIVAAGDDTAAIPREGSRSNTERVSGQHVDLLAALAVPEACREVVTAR